MGSVYGTAETLLDVYGDPTVAASADGLAGVLVAVLEMDPAVLARQPGLLGGVAEVGPRQG
jgi:hypothetical protein